MSELELFSAALAIADAGERSKYLDQACGNDAALRQRIDVLLRNHHNAGSFLESPAGTPLVGVPAPMPDATLDLRAQESGDDAGSQDLESEANMTAVENAGDDGVDALDFLQPSTKPGSRGRLGHYEVLEVLGQGGFGVVVRAFDEKLQRVVAIKMMSPQLAATSPARKRFLREARASAKVRHENVVQIYAVEEKPIPHLVMEYIPGRTLQQKLDDNGPLDPPEMLRLAVQIAHGIAAAHAQGLIHRDIKPANIILEEAIEPRVKITDFGLARAADDASLTQSGTVAGTPMYMAPEQAEGKTIDQRADLFSLGSVFYVMLSGRPPFRASGTMAVLKRVCEDAPRPIREIIPEVPEWLCDIISKLHAKKPEDRYQTAKEVADLLAQRLADVQAGREIVRAPSVSERVEAPTPIPATQPGTGNSAPRRRWKIVAALGVIALLVAGLFASPFLYRYLTDQGTLTYSGTIDPNIERILIKRDGQVAADLITRHGTVQLPAGDYEAEIVVKEGYQLTKYRVGPFSHLAHTPDALGWQKAVGKTFPLTLTRDFHVGLSLELAKMPDPSKQPFIILAKDGRLERSQATLTEAVAAAKNGDTIEIRGDGPFVTGPIVLDAKDLIIRCGADFRPVLKQDPRTIGAGDPLIRTTGSLVLEGLELVRAGAEKEGWLDFAVVSSKAPVRIANCRFLTVNKGGGEFLAHNQFEGACEVRNSVFIGGQLGSGFGGFKNRSRVVMENNVVITIGIGCTFYVDSEPGVAEVPVRLARNTLLHGLVMRTGNGIPEQKGAAPPRLRIEAEGNIIDPSNHAWQHLLTLHQAQQVNKPGARELAPAEAETFLHQLVNWRDHQNVYAEGLPAIGLINRFEEMPPTKERLGLKGWNEFWKLSDTDSIEGPIVYQGGDLFAKLNAAPEKLTPEDFRLAKGSAGKGAGPGGKDLGADVDLVGPGPAYERWKNTPEYQEWLKKTGQGSTKATPVEPFVVIVGKNKKEYKFPTLAQAVAAAVSGDTIEIRGDGPLATPPIVINGKALMIRAGALCQPVLQLDSEGVRTDATLLTTDAPLVLEGLELVRVGKSEPVAPGRRAPGLVDARNNLSVANCRFFQRDSEHSSIVGDGKDCEVRNCIMLGTVHGVFRAAGPERTTSVDNCVFACPGHGMVMYEGQDRLPVGSHYSTRNTILANSPFAVSHHGAIPDLDQQPGAAVPSIRWQSSENVLHASDVVLAFDFVKEKAEGKEALLRRLMLWEEKSNVYQADMPLLGVMWAQRTAFGPSAWEKFWGHKNTGSSHGRIRYMGGDIWARMKASPEKLVPADFRLHPDSAGKGARKDGKDLGADVDLVGPGPAYERWKKTPEYQEWRKQTER